MKTLEEYIEEKRKEVAIMLAGKFNVKTSGATNDFLDLIDEILRDTARESLKAVVPEENDETHYEQMNYSKLFSKGFNTCRSQILSVAKEKGIIS